MTSIFADLKRPLSLIDRLKRLNEIGIALSRENDVSLLLEKILLSAMEVTNADGGTVYDFYDEQLHFHLLLNESLDIHHGGSSSTPCELPAISLYDEHEQENTHHVAAFAANRKETVNIKDSYSDKRFDFSGTRVFDQTMHYRSKSFLTVPMIDHEGKITSVLQLINARDPVSNEILQFNQEFQDLVESLASQAAIVISKKKLINDQKKLFEAFIELIASAIDDKSPYTGGHCRRVPELTLMLANAAIKTDTGPMAEFDMDESDFYALKIAGWLHDCGKIVTPEYVIDKATKLETIHDRIGEIDTRFEVLKRDEEIRFLKGNQSRQDYEAKISQLDADRDFIRFANIGREFITTEDSDRIDRIASYQWQGPDGETLPMLTGNEIYNLKIARGTLTHEEREIINGHMNTTIKMLEQLPYPDYLANVPEYAGGHHEKMDGSGYPKGLTRDELSIPARIMAVADIFEAITAPDRPYREPLKLSEALKLMGEFKQNDHIDPDLFDVFVRQKVYIRYAELFMTPAQIDHVDETAIPGYTP
jgi:HD-GYP domain-containing protein (c-di-GMP phosphodiesterase class II)